MGDVQLLHDVLGPRQGHHPAEHLFHKGSPNLVLGRPESSGPWGRPQQYPRYGGFHPIKDLTSGLCEVYTLVILKTIVFTCQPQNRLESKSLRENAASFNVPAAPSL